MKKITMVDSDLFYWLKVSLTIILSVLSFSGLIGYFYLSFRRLYQNRDNRWWVGLVAFILPLISLTFGIFILMMWNPITRSDFWPLFFLSFIVSLILGQSVTSPYKLADWWIEFGKWLQKRK
jgi:hypothetical protein